MFNYIQNYKTFTPFPSSPQQAPPSNEGGANALVSLIIIIISSSSSNSSNDIINVSNDRRDTYYLSEMPIAAAEAAKRSQTRMLMHNLSML